MPWGYIPPVPLVFPVEAFGAAGNGVANDTAAIQAAINAAQAVQGEVLLGPHVYLVKAASAGVPALSIDGNKGSLKIRGAGPKASVIRAGSSMSAILSDTNLTYSTFDDFQLDGNLLATKCESATMPSGETSTSRRWRNVAMTNVATATNDWPLYINGHEDGQLLNCEIGTLGAKSVQWIIPNGAATIVGGILPGQIDLTYQLFTLVGVTTGPLTVNNAAADRIRTLNVIGCYIYDSATLQCLSSVDNWTLANVVGCYLVMTNQADGMKGTVPSGVGVYVEGTIFIQPPGATPAAVVGFEMSGGSGLVTFRDVGSQFQAGHTGTAMTKTGGATGFLSTQGQIGDFAGPARSAITGALPLNTNVLNPYPVAANVYFTAGTNAITAVQVGPTGAQATVPGCTAAGGQTTPVCRVPAGAYFQVTAIAGGSPSFTFFPD